MNKLHIAGACLALMLAACGDESTAPSAAIDTSLDKITQEGIYAHFAYLADDKLEGLSVGIVIAHREIEHGIDRETEIGLEVACAGT